MRQEDDSRVLGATEESGEDKKAQSNQGQNATDASSKNGRLAIKSVNIEVISDLGKHGFDVTVGTEACLECRETRK